ncbi:hypothetical protein CANINC_001590 [Pichia inconspicua]|uniref:C2H2-type domain-containing protein n=1 Tax=Pichia inconspicua TaxID=52247 RepID=A0A4T0X3B1_9ASCO|nr:hypothetical protein CANINC_001590 [[Candida] inconspicua]
MNSLQNKVEQKHNRGTEISKDASEILHNRHSSDDKDGERGRNLTNGNDVSISRSVSSSRASSPRPKRYLCDFGDCRKAYSRPSLLEEHMRTHYGYRPFKCTVENCGQTFTKKGHLTRHMLKHTEEKDKPFHCSICGKGVNSSQHLRRHEKTHFKSFKCTYDGCDESFHKHQTLKMHIRNVHEAESNRHICDICSKEFNRPGRLQDHMVKFHSDSPKLICDFPGCYKTFRVWSALQLHIKTCHPRLECEICGKKCVGQSGLANHMLIHNEETVIKHWKCQYCDERFHKKEDAVKHYAEKHPRVDLPDELKYETHERDKIKEKAKQSEEEILYYMNKKEEARKKKRMMTELQDSAIDPIQTSITMDDINAVRHSKRTTDSAENLLDSDTSVVSEYGFIVSKPTLKKFKTHEDHRIPSSPDVLDLIIDNVDNRLKCPYVSCKRLFRKSYDLDRHLAWHEKQDLSLNEKLTSLSENQKAENTEDLTET